MRRGHPALLPLVALLVGGCVTTGSSSPARLDLESVRPEDVAPDTRGLEQRAWAAYHAEEWESAARAFLALAAARPGTAVDLYNVACAFGRLERPSQSARFLEAAWNAGFQDIARIRDDPDLDPVREAPVFADTVGSLNARAAAQARRRGTVIPVVAEASLDARVIVPGEPPPPSGWPVVVALHGRGEAAEAFAERLAVDAPRALWVFPQGPYAEERGFSWFRVRQVERAAYPSRELTEDYVLETLNVVRSSWPIDPERVVVIGFSQGGYLAFSLGLRHPDVFAAAIGASSRINPGEHSPEVLARAANAGLEVLILHSPEDGSVPFDLAVISERMLTEAGIAHTLARYPGGHVVPSDFVARIRGVLARLGGERDRYR